MDRLGERRAQKLVRKSPNQVGCFLFSFFYDFLEIRLCCIISLRFFSNPHTFLCNCKFAFILFSTEIHFVLIFFSLTSRSAIFEDGSVRKVGSNWDELQNERLANLWNEGTRTGKKISRLKPRRNERRTHRQFPGRKGGLEGENDPTDET